MNRDDMKGFARDLVRYGFATTFELRGCSEREIARLEACFKLNLPESYKSFLSVMGHKAGTFYQGTDCFYHDLFDLREWLEATLAEDRSPFQLTKDAFVFSSHQGVIYHFFYTIDNKPDPTVWGYCEGDMQPKKIDTSFSAYLANSLEDFRRIRASRDNV